jgi:GNAT superfamily N-acetyltransferase
MLADVEIRPADASDAPAMADAHIDSIRVLGAGFYSGEAVDDWAACVAPEMYVRAMDRGELFFLALGKVDGRSLVLGFASDYVVRGTTHGTSVYVRRIAARRGVGSALLETAEECGRSRGATDVEIEASLAGVPFYRACGYEHVRRIATQLSSGKSIDCVLMRKKLT